MPRSDHHLHEVCDMSLLQQQSNVVTSVVDESDSEDELEVVVAEASPGGGALAWRKMSQKIHPAYSVSTQTEEVGKVFKGTKIRHAWTFVLPEDAVETGVELPLDARTTKLEIVHSTMSGRIEIMLNDELSFASMMRGESAWKLAKKNDLSPILFDAQLYFKNKHTVRVTIKNASEKQFKYFLHVDGISFGKMPSWRGPIPIVKREVPEGGPADFRGELSEFVS